MKFLIIGLGSMGKRRIRNLQYLKAGNIIGFDLRADRRKEAEEKYKIKTFRNLDVALKENPDVFIISTPPDKHGEYALLAAKNGKHFFIEASVILEKQIIEANEIAKKKRIVAMPSCTMRFNWRMRKIKEIIDKIGKVMLVNYHMGQWLPDWHPSEDIRKFYVGKRSTGAAREMVPFEIEWIEWVLGPIKSVSCIKGKVSDLPVDIDDTYSLNMVFKSGVIGNILIDVVSRNAIRRIEIMGSKGTIIMDWDENNVRLYDANKKSWSEFSEEEKIKQKQYWIKDDMYIEEMKHFINVLKGEEKLMYNLDDDIRNLEILLKSEKSSNEGRVII